MHEAVTTFSEGVERQCLPVDGWKQPADLGEGRAYSQFRNGNSLAGAIRASRISPMETASMRFKYRSHIAAAASARHPPATCLPQLHRRVAHRVNPFRALEPGAQIAMRVGHALHCCIARYV